MGPSRPVLPGPGPRPRSQGSEAPRLRVRHPLSAQRVLVLGLFEPRGAAGERRRGPGSRRPSPAAESSTARRARVRRRGWASFTACFVIGPLGEALGLPSWAVDASRCAGPFGTARCRRGRSADALDVLAPDAGAARAAMLKSQRSVQGRAGAGQGRC
jgi:hypothetical protein